MTDNEIIKALESEIHLAEYVDSDYCSNVNLEIITSVLDLINRLKAENERLSKITRPLIAEIKAEAYKEFAERLKHSFFDNGYESPDVDFDYFVDNLTKEMVGDK